MVVWAASLSPSDWTSTAIATRPTRSKVKREVGMVRRDFTNGGTLNGNYLGRFGGTKSRRFHLKDRFPAARFTFT
jgi:hypothetical protein